MKKERYALVIDNLKTIRDAELAYASVNRKFTNKYEDLVNFIERIHLQLRKLKT